MSIWHKEVIRVNGDLKAYIEVQDDWTGNIKGGLRDIHIDGNNYYVRADCIKVDVTENRNNFLAHESKVKTALDWYNKTKF